MECPDLSWSGGRLGVAARFLMVSAIAALCTLVHAADWTTFQKAYGPVYFDHFKESGRLSLVGFRQPPLPMGDVIEINEVTIDYISRLFLQQHRALFGVDTAQLVVDKLIPPHPSPRLPDRRLCTVMYKQFYKGVHVSRARVHLSYANDSLYSIRFDYYPDIDLVTDPTVSGEEAVERAVDQLPDPEWEYPFPGSPEPEPTLSIWTTEDKDSTTHRLVWMVWTEGRACWIDAHTGELVQVSSLGMR